MSYAPYSANYDTLVYPFPQKRVNATNARFVTVLTDQPGLRVVGIDGEFGVSSPWLSNIL